MVVERVAMLDLLLVALTAGWLADQLALYNNKMKILLGLMYHKMW